MRKERKMKVFSDEMFNYLNESEQEQHHKGSTEERP